jgi:hypothetical protein
MKPNLYPSYPFTGFNRPGPVPVREDPYEEAIHFPDLRLREFENQYTSPAEAEKALRDLIGGGINHQGSDVEIDMSQAIVPGFNKNIKLLPHQVLGRAWMREREDGKKLGGILADDMGQVVICFMVLAVLDLHASLGKTIQALTRIVEGRPEMSDQESGWAAATLCVRSTPRSDLFSMIFL